MNWLDDLRIEDLPEVYQDIAQEKGLPYAVALAEIFGGRQIYFPQSDSLFTKAKRRYIISHFNGGNHAELAKATGYCEREVYDILREDRESKQPRMFA